MEQEQRLNADDFSAAGLGTAVACAVAIGVADFAMDESEQQEIARNLCAMLGVDAETASQLVMQGLEQAASIERESLFEQARNTLETPGREGCFVLACAVASRSGGIGVKEGLALQSLAKTLEIGYPSPRYNELLGRGMQIGRLRQ